jgi:hypothetical protein
VLAVVVTQTHSSLLPQGTKFSQLEAAQPGEIGMAVIEGGCQREVLRWFEEEGFGGVFFCFYLPGAVTVSVIVLVVVIVLCFLLAAAAV